MNVANRLIAFYQKNTPRPSYGGVEGDYVQEKRYLQWPKNEETKSLGAGTIIVWKGQFPADPNIPPIDGYCVVTAILDTSGRTDPNKLPLWPKMKGHSTNIVIYVDAVDRICMKAIGGFTSFSTRNAEIE